MIELKSGTSLGHVQPMAIQIFENSKKNVLMTWSNVHCNHFGFVVIVRILWTVINSEAGASIQNQDQIQGK